MMPPPPPPQQQQQQGRDGSQSSVTDTARVALLATSRGAADLPSNPTTATQAVQRERLEKGIAAVRPPMLRQSMHQTFVEMLQDAGPSFRLLQDVPPPSPPLPFRVLDHFKGDPASCVIIFRIALTVSALCVLQCCCLHRKMYLAWRCPVAVAAARRPYYGLYATHTVTPFTVVL